MQLRSYRSTNGHASAQINNGSVSNGVHSNGVCSNGTTTLSNTGDKNVKEGRLSALFKLTFIPFCMLTLIPNLCTILWYTAVECGGSYTIFLQRLYEGGVVFTIVDLWKFSFEQLTFEIWYILIGYCVFALLLLILVPGPIVKGPVTPNGHVPVYKDNGFRCYIISLVAFMYLTYYLKQNDLTPTYVYDKLPAFLLATNIAGHVLCTFLLIKGLIAPSTPDSGSSGNWAFDYYWGLDLYPRILGVDIKVFTNCRFGMTVWPLLIMIYTLKNYELYGFVDSSWVSCVLQLVYITKFFWWEAGYYSSIDIIMDRAGYMICWGCLCYIPGMYAAASMYLVSHPVRLGPGLSALILLCGVLSITVNYWADYQRQITRKTNGKSTIWGKEPSLIHAKYTLEAGHENNSILLVSGFWAIARHFNYLPEILLSFFWCLPALFDHVMPYSYVIYLTILLVHRAYRDDAKCLHKYGKYWEEYCRLVPYKILPGVL